MKNEPLNCLMFADDCVVMSQSFVGLQRAIDKTASHFESLGLSINTKKTKVMVFNSRGLKPDKYPQFNFTIGESTMEKVDTYTYLGLVFKPSGSVTSAVDELGFLSAT